MLEDLNQIYCGRSLDMNIRLRERGTKKLHVFKGWREQVKAPENRPSWMPEKIFKPFVKKEKIETLE
jgi:hypothetical protein